LRGVRRVVVLIAVAALALGACHKAAPSEAPAKVFPSSPVPPPDSLVADVVVRGPDALWGKLQQGVGGPLSHMPGTVGGLLAATAKLDLTLAGEIDGAAPAYGAIARVGPSFGWLAAIKLRDLAHAHAALLEGAKPRFVGRDAGDGIVMLSAPVGAPAESHSLALSPLGYLLVARGDADLLMLAPYATRTLPARPLDPHALAVSATHAALAGPIHDQITSAIGDLRTTASMLDATQRRQHGGKDPDFGDPTAVIQRLDDYAQGKLALLADLDHAVLTLDAGDDDLDLELSLAPGAGPSAKTFASYVTGDASPLLSLSAETEAALLLRDDPKTRADEMKSTEEGAVAIFKRQLSDKDAAAVQHAFETWGSSRGPWLTVAAELGGAPALTVRTPTADPDAAMRGVNDFVELAHRPVFHDLLEARFSVIGVSTATAAVSGFGSTSIATFRRASRDKTASADAPEVAIAWAATGEILHVGAALSAARALRASKDATSLLGSDIRHAGKLGTLRDRATIVLLARPNFGPETEGPRASLVLGAGRDKANGWVMLEVDDGMVRNGLGRWFEL
jgi:hypothetical protein